MLTSNPITAIVLASGSGKRFSPVRSKVCLRFNGKYIFEYSLETFQNIDEINEIILVGPNDLNKKEYKITYPKLTHIVSGGNVRQKSVLNGLLMTKDDCAYVFIHDAARPFFTAQMINNMLETINSCDGVIPLLPVYDAIKEKNEYGKISPLNSKNIFRTQTPQLYKRQILLNAFLSNQYNLEKFRDEMEILSSVPDISIKSVPGEYLAEKITTQEEWMLLQKLLPKVVKSGIGYDFHPFILSKPLILGGCPIPFLYGLEGDSDGDVLCHSILDSLLGALSLGDIGRYIGIKTPNAINASSLDFLKQLMNDQAIPWFQILHIDATIICKDPLLNPWIENMVEYLTSILKIDKNQINIKSTTDKGVDGAGEGKGIRVISIATIQTLQGRDSWQKN